MYSGISLSSKKHNYVPKVSHNWKKKSSCSFTELCPWNKTRSFLVVAVLRRNCEKWCSCLYYCKVFATVFVHFVQRVSWKELMQDKTQAIFNQNHSFECCQGDKSEMIWLQHIPSVLSMNNIHSSTVGYIRLTTHVLLDVLFYFNNWL